jgi:hypothetical protein
MKATVLFGAGDIRIENVPDAKLVNLSDVVLIGLDSWSPCPIVTGHRKFFVVRSVTKYSTLRREREAIN